MADIRALRCVDELKSNIFQSKENIKNLDENIRKLSSWGGVGGPRADLRGPLPRRVSLSGDADQFQARNRLGGPIGRAAAGSGLGGAPATLRRGSLGLSAGSTGNAFSRLGLPVSVGRRRDLAPDSGDEGDEDGPARRPSVQSSVIVTPKDEKTRQDIIAQQSGGNEGRARNRRMFGLLMGTLVQFKQEEQSKADQEKKRKAVEQKLEMKQREQKEQEIAERRQMEEDMRGEKRRLRHLEQKMELVELHEEWEAQTHALENFVRTESKPNIFYMPKIHVDATIKKLEATKKTLDAIIMERRKLLEQDIAELTSNPALHDDDDDEEEDGGTTLPTSKKMANKDENNDSTHKDTSKHHSHRHHSRGDTRTVVETTHKSVDADKVDHSDLEDGDDVNVGIDYEPAPGTAGGLLDSTELEDGEVGNKRSVHGELRSMVENYSSDNQSNEQKFIMKQSMDTEKLGEKMNEIEMESHNENSAREVEVEDGEVSDNENTRARDQQKRRRSSEDNENNAGGHGKKRNNDDDSDYEKRSHKKKKDRRDDAERDDNSRKRKDKKHSDERRLRHGSDDEREHRKRHGSNEERRKRHDKDRDSAERRHEEDARVSHVEDSHNETMNSSVNEDEQHQVMNISDIVVPPMPMDIGKQQSNQ